MSLNNPPYAKETLVFGVHSPTLTTLTQIVQGSVFTTEAADKVHLHIESRGIDAILKVKEQTYNGFDLGAATTLLTLTGATLAGKADHAVYPTGDTKLSMEAQRLLVEIEYTVNAQGLLYDDPAPTWTGAENVHNSAMIVKDPGAPGLKVWATKENIKQ